MMNARSGTTDTPFLYNGKYGVQTDANGLLHMRARYYSPILRRFMTTDPIGLEGGQNYYAFADGNPLVYIDPFGLCAESSGGYSGGWGNPGNWWRGIYTGDPNASDEVYDAALDASSDYMLYEGGVRGGYIGVGKGLKVPGKGNLAGMGGIRANWTIDRGKSASVDVGLGLQDRGRTTVLGLGTKPFVSQTIGMGVLMSFGLRRRAFKTQ
jgi:RHS repeat-associated protein